jgi:hypothetical protein
MCLVVEVCHRWPHDCHVVPFSLGTKIRRKQGGTHQNKVHKFSENHRFPVKFGGIVWIWFLESIDFCRIWSISSRKVHKFSGIHRFPMKFGGIVWIQFLKSVGFCRILLILLRKVNKFSGIRRFSLKFGGIVWIQFLKSVHFHDWFCWEIGGSNFWNRSISTQFDRFCWEIGSQRLIFYSSLNFLTLCIRVSDCLAYFYRSISTQFDRFCWEIGSKNWIRQRPIFY